MHETAQHHFVKLDQMLGAASYFHLGSCGHSSPVHHVPTLWPANARVLLVPSGGRLFNVHFDMDRL